MLGILAGGAWYDMKKHRVPNWWILGAVLCGLGLSVLRVPEGSGGLVLVSAVLRYLVRLILTTAVLFPLFVIRVMGAGDIKMMAVMTGCLGFSSGVRAICYGFLIGAILALVNMLLRRSLRKRLMILAAYIRRLFLTKEILQYYQADRDGEDGVVPFVLCLLIGYMWYMAGG